MLSLSFTDLVTEAPGGSVLPQLPDGLIFTAKRLPPEATQVSSAHVALATASPVAMSIVSKSREWNSTTDSEED